MNKLIKLSSLLLLGLFTACESDENITVISGKVIDIETNAPVADAKLNLTVADGLDIEIGFANPVHHTTTSTAEGDYTFILPENEQQQLYLVTPEKTGYVEVREPNYIANALRAGEKNHCDVEVAKGSYLNLNIRPTSSDPDKSIELYLEYAIGTSSSPMTPIVPYTGEKIVINNQTSDSTLTRGFYFKYTPQVKLTWRITTSGATGTTESFTETIDLKEYDTVDFEISY